MWASSMSTIQKTPGKLAAMGIVMKRRDNAQSPKVVYGTGRDSAEQERPSRRIVRTFQSDET
jgi:hypothetical protein